MMIDILDLRNVRWPENEGDHADFAKTFLIYNSETGDLIWRVNKGRIRAGDIAGNLMKTGYRQIFLAQKRFLAHRLCWLIYYGSWPSGVIDHINGNSSDNRISNLRTVTQLENCRNSSLRKDNKTGVTGVSYDSKFNKWSVRIKEGPKLRYHHIGRFSKFEDAVAARKAAEKKYGYHENHGRQK